jgi:di/tricarboxylate transporter
VTVDQGIVFGVLLAALVLFIAGKWRYDLVALLALLAVTVIGLVPADAAFAGFGHPAVVTVAAVLVVSRGLRNAGVVDLISGLMLKVGKNPSLQVLGLTALVTALSAFMNNIGALALLLPVAVQMARNANRSPSFLLMPLAFGSLLGGMTTLIGTPPNIIIATFREQTGAEPFRMFDFAPVGVGIAGAGVIFIALVGWRLIPRRPAESSSDDLFKVNEYVAEVHVAADSQFVGRPLHELEEHAEGSAIVLSLGRGERHTAAPSGSEPLREGDVLSIEADPESLKSLMESAHLTLGKGEKNLKDTLGSKDVTLVEAVVTPDSIMAGSTPWSLYLRLRYGINVIGVARYGVRVSGPLRSLRFQSGDVLLVQGPEETIFKSLSVLGCLPLATRGLRLGEPRRIGLAVGIFGVALVANAMGVLPIHVTFAAAAAAMPIAGLISIREAYESIDWPIVVLVGAMIPVGASLEATGGAALVAQGLLGVSGSVTPAVMLAIFLLATMFLSDLVNNAAAAIIVAPIAISTAARLDVSADPFLMAVAVGASCAFLTPIGHQSNAMVMAPGGYRFGDYWRMGLPLELVIAAMAVPLILTFWPLG